MRYRLIGFIALVAYWHCMNVPARAQDVIKIGATAPITGTFAQTFAVQGKLWDAWEKAQNEEGGIFVKSLNKKLPIKIIYYDDQGDPKASVKFYERLINQDKVDFLMGPPGSPIAFAATTVSERYKFPMILGPSNDPQIFARGFTHIQGVLALGEEWSRNLFDMFAHEKKILSVALLVEDSLYSRGIGIGVRNYVKRDGMSLVFDQTVPSDTQDFTAIIVKMKEAKPDLVYVATFPPFFIRYAKQANELGFKPAALECSTCASASVRDALGPNANGITGEVYWVPGVKFGNYQMLEKVLKTSGVDPVQWTSALVSLASLEVIRDGIEKTGSLDRNAVFETIKKLNVMTVLGPYHAETNGAGSLVPFPAQIQNGKVVVVWPPAAKTGDYVYPRP